MAFSASTGRPRMSSRPACRRRTSGCEGCARSKAAMGGSAAFGCPDSRACAAAISWRVLSGDSPRKREFTCKPSVWKRCAGRVSGATRCPTTAGFAGAWASLYFGRRQPMSRSMHNPTTDSLGPLRQRARAALERDDVAAAERDFSRLLEQVPEDAEALQFLAARHLSRGDAGRAVDMLGTVSRKQPDNASVWYQLGSAQMAGGDFAAAADS